MSRLSIRYLERAVGRLILLTVIMLVGVASLGTPFAWPTTPRGWLVLCAFFLIPLYFQWDGIRDRQLRHAAQEPDV